MYSGLALNNHSGRFLGVHQKFNRLAYRNLVKILNRQIELPIPFPALDMILHFEGKNGPDGLKLKSPGYNEPYHFYDPYKPDQTDLLTHLKNHFRFLKKALAKQDEERAAWEAAWLAHIIVDGLTPAHHYPYEQQIYSLRGQTLGFQTKISDKIWIKKRHLKTSRSDQTEKTGLTKLIDKNWQLWGSKGLILTHALFEIGVALIIKPLNLFNSCPTKQDLKAIADLDLVKTFQTYSLQIADHQMYRNFYFWGWTPKLALQVKNLLAPLTVKLITLAWWQAIISMPNISYLTPSMKAKV